MKRVLITGCNSGFGLGAARMFAERGDAVYATVRKPQEASDLIALRDRGLAITILQLDVRDARRAEGVVQQVLAEGGVDVLVNNAGVSMFGAVEDISVDLAREMMEVNLFGPLRLIRLVLPSMRAQRRGHIVNVSSIAGFAPLAFMSTYSMSKHALDALSFSLAAEVEPFGIKVSTVSPGGFATAVGGKLWSPDAPSGEADYTTIVNELLAGYHAHVVGRSPETVSAAIVAAADGEASCPRWFLGDDAEEMARMRRRMDDAEWLRNMLPVAPS